MKLNDLVLRTSILTTMIKDEYFYPNGGGIDFSKVPEPIEDIEECEISIDLDRDTKVFVPHISSDLIRLSAHNYQGHNEIMNKITKTYLNVYKMIDNYYNSLSDEEKLKLELEE